jgi:hypothetical protein
VTRRSPIGTNCIRPTTWEPPSRTTSFIAVLIASLITVLLQSAAGSTSAHGRTRPASPASRPLAVPWRTLTPPGASPKVLDSAFDGRAWWFVGSVLDDSITQEGGVVGIYSGQRRPAMWTASPSLDALIPVVVVPTTPYGAVAELWSVAATERAVVAFGAATGGAHGNPRSASWVLDRATTSAAPTLREVKAVFELYGGPRQIGVRTVAAFEGGFVIVGTRVSRNGGMGAAVWTSIDGTDFVLRDDDPVLSSRAGEQQMGSDVVVDGDRLLAVGEQFAVRRGIASTDAIAWTSADGATWAPLPPSQLGGGGPGEERYQRVAVSGERGIIGGTFGTTDTRVAAWMRSGPSAPQRWVRSTLPLPPANDPLSAVTGVAIGERSALIAARIDQRVVLVTQTSAGADRQWRSVTVPALAPERNASLSVRIANGSVIAAGTGRETGWVAVASEADLGSALSRAG